MRFNHQAHRIYSKIIKYFDVYQFCPFYKTRVSEFYYPLKLRNQMFNDSSNVQHQTLTKGWLSQMLSFDRSRIANGLSHSYATNIYIFHEPVYTA